MTFTVPRPGERHGRQDRARRHRTGRPHHPARFRQARRPERACRHTVPVFSI